MGILKRLIRYGPAVFSQGLSIAALFKLIALIAHEPDPAGSATNKPSLFVYTMH